MSIQTEIARKREGEAENSL